MSHLTAVSLLAAIAVAIVGAGCVGDGGGSDGSFGGEPIVSCPALEDLESYRYDVSVESAMSPSPAADADGPETGAPLTALANALAQLFSDFRLTGSYVHPDRSQAVLTFKEDELELLAIGEEAWVRSGEEWEADETGTDDLLTPLVLCEEVMQELSLSLRAGGPESADVNGVATQHYELDPAKTQDLPSFLGQEVAGGYTVDLWVAEDGRWPARLQIESAEDGEEAGFRLTMDVRDVNDEGIGIEAPR